MNRDDLGLIRTHLANERTVLAYVRTSLAFLAAGAGLVHFIPFTYAVMTGWILIAIGTITFVAGINRFLNVRQRINQLSA
jgi:putative membrane protein